MKYFILIIILLCHSLILYGSNTRLFFAPTGRTLPKGNGYFNLSELVLPSGAYGITDRFTLMGGASLMPGVSISEQLKYIAPKYRLYHSDKTDFSLGSLHLDVENEFSAGIGFATGTYGTLDKSFTLGIGFGYSKQKRDNFKISNHPVIIFGGNLKISENTALISENWILTGEDFSMEEQPFSLGVRIYGNKLTTDIGAIFVKKLLDEGVFIPWLSISYSFEK